LPDVTMHQNEGPDPAPCRMFATRPSMHNQSLAGCCFCRLKIHTSRRYTAVIRLVQSHHRWLAGHLTMSRPIGEYQCPKKYGIGEQQNPPHADLRRGR